MAEGIDSGKFEMNPISNMINMAHGVLGRVLPVTLGPFKIGVEVEDTTFFGKMGTFHDIVDPVASS